MRWINKNFVISYIIINSQMKSHFQTYTIEQIEIKSGKFLNYKSLPPIIFPSTVDIKISQNDLQDIDILGKQQYPHLQTVFIVMNKISYVPRLRTCRLTHLILENNIINDISAFAQGFYPELVLVRFNNNRITVLPRLNAPNLERL